MTQKAPDITFAAGMQAPAVGCKRGRPALVHPPPNTFQEFATQQSERTIWTAPGPAVHDHEGGGDSMPDHPSKLQRSCAADDQEHVVESMRMPQGLMESPGCNRRASWCTADGKGLSSHSTTSSHWQVQVWPQPVFKLHTDVLEDDATSPFCTSFPGGD